MFRPPSVATSLSFSPTNDFLATSHVDSVGVFLWANRAQYAEVSFQTISETDVVDIEFPTMQEDIDEDGSFILPSLFPDRFLRGIFVPWPLLMTDELTGFSVSNLIGPQSLDSSARQEDVFSSPDQLAGELATLTLLPRSRWQTLLKLEVIQVCNGNILQRH